MKISSLYLRRLSINTFFLCASLGILGPGPDSQSMDYFFYHYQHHYFTFGNKMLAFTATYTGGLIAFKLIVKIVAAIVLSVLPIFSIFDHLLLLVYASLVTQGNYREGLASILVGVALMAKSSSGPALASTIHNSAIFFMTYYVKYLKDRKALLIFFIIALGGVVFLQRDSLYLMIIRNPSFEAHTSSGINVGAEDSKVASYFYLLVFLFLYLTTFRKKWLLAILCAFGGAVSGFALFTRFLLYFKTLLFMSLGESKGMRKVVLRTFAVTIIFLQLRNKYFWPV